MSPLGPSVQNPLPRVEPRSGRPGRYRSAGLCQRILWHQASPRRLESGRDRRDTHTPVSPSWSGPVQSPEVSRIRYGGRPTRHAWRGFSRGPDGHTRAEKEKGRGTSVSKTDSAWLQRLTVQTYRLDRVCSDIFGFENQQIYSKKVNHKHVGRGKSGHSAAMYGAAGRREMVRGLGWVPLPQLEPTRAELFASLEAKLSALPLDSLSTCPSISSN